MRIKGIQNAFVKDVKNYNSHFCEETRAILEK